MYVNVSNFQTKICKRLFTNTGKQIRTILLSTVELVLYHTRTL